VPAWIADISDVAYLYLDAIAKLGLSGIHVVGQSLGGWIRARDGGALDAAPAQPHLDLGRPASTSKACPRPIFLMIDPEEQARLAYCRSQDRRGSGAAHRRRQVPGPRDPQPHRQRSLSAGSPRFFNPRLERWLHRVERSDARDLGRGRPHHSAGLWRGVPSPDSRDRR